VRSRSITRSSALTFTVAVPRPELTIVEDTSYPLASDPRSTFPYRIDSPDYATLGTTATTVFGTTDKHVRLVRYVVSNSGALPVAIDPISIALAWRLAESWDMRSPAMAAGTTAIGTTCPSLATGAPGYVLTPFCAVGEVYAGELGPASADGLCEPALDLGWAAIQGTAAVVGRAETLDASGVEGGPAPKVGGKAIVPGAFDGVPGRVALYLTRPLVNSAAPGTWSGSAWTSSQRVWSKAWAPAEGIECPEGWPGEWDAVWDLYVRPQLLMEANDELIGSFTLKASAVIEGAIAGPATPMATVHFTRNIPH
jgi:hypothetical protein